MNAVRQLAILVMALLPGLSAAWNDTGHMIVAGVAWRHMTPKARVTAAKLVNLLATERTRDFIAAACWADDTKVKETGPWHYIDLYFRSDGAEANLQPPPHNVVWAVNKFTDTLGSPLSSDVDNAEALRYLIHFVGDLSQPLHCTSRITNRQPRGDAGGNRFLIEDPHSVTGRRPHNLHYLWDDGCGIFSQIQRPLDEPGRKKLDAMVHKCEAELGAEEQRMAVSITDPMSWALDGQRLAEAFVYQTPENTPPSSAYLAQGQRLCRKQVAVAGLRLATLLNRLLG
jgi:hypothetical protein